MTTVMPRPDQRSADRRTLTLRDYLLPVARRWMFVLAVVVVFTAAAVAYAVQKTVKYTASTKVYIAPGSGIGAGSLSQVQSMADQAEFLTSTETAATVARQIGYPGSGAALAGSVHTQVSTATNFLTISSTQASAALADKVVNGFAQEVVGESARATVASDQAQIASLQTQLAAKALKNNPSEKATLQTQITQLRAAIPAAKGNAQQIDVAAGATASTRDPLKDGLFVALGSLVGAVLLAYGFEALDPRLRTVHEVAATYHYPVLTTVLHDDGVDAFTEDRPTLPAGSRESFRQLQITLDLAAIEHPYKTILVTSAVPGEGKSTVARNLALALAEDGRRVGLIDADLRKPRLSTTLGITSGPGLAEVLDGEVSPTEVIVEVDTALRHALPLSVIPGGLTHDIAPAAFGSQRFTAAVAALSDRCDVVVIDSTPLVAVADALPVARAVDAVIIVARGSTDSRSAQRAGEILAHVPNVHVVGLVVNDVAQPDAAQYGYGYGYGYGESSPAGTA
jgi:succinoglycan biosynthesis transport protein ExoP